MRSRLLIGALVLVLLATAVFAGGQGEGSEQKDVLVNETGWPIVNEKITLRGFGRLDPQHGPWEEMTLFKDHEERTNINVVWDTPGKTNVEERKNLVLASGDLPDFFMKTVLNDSDTVKFGADGALIPLEDYIEKWAPNLNKWLLEYPEVRQGITTPDGHIYSFPRMQTFLPARVWRYPLANTVWLENVGLDIPKTHVEFLDMLRAFRDQDANGNGDPNDEVPYSSHNPRFGFRGIAGMFGIQWEVAYDGRYPMVIKNGKVHMQNMDPAYKEALQFYATMYQEKLLDQEIFTHSAKEYFGKLAAGRMGFTPLWQPRNAATHAKEWDAIVPPKGPRGDQNWTFLNPMLQNINAFAITSSNKYPEATIRWVDYFYGDEGATAMYLVREGEFYTVQPDGSFRIKPEILESELGLENYFGEHTIPPGGGAPGFYTGRHMAPHYEGTLMLSYIEKVEKYLPKQFLRPAIRSSEINAREMEIRSDLDTYFDEMSAKFAAGEESFDEWDTYVANLKKIGIEELEQIIQEALFGK